MPTNQSLSTEKDLRKKYDIRYNHVRCKEYKVGTVVEFKTKYEGNQKGMIANIHESSSGMIVYQIGVLANKESCIGMHAVIRQDIIGIVKGDQS